ncbi:hypothetical protein H0H81_012351 [Sphagnurus paluster]|uniref:Uncharacterized protein n=1 Tax=Sphagnurus paluster TaxID=117069 RepID=A0A9P7GUX4_9AGAR|nr:hypothetical protein H0H81_012351 [Sphagnurus paluster]
MWGYRALQGLDVTYQVLGHLVENDGTIVGLVSEAQVGRLLQYRDRSLIYEALSRVQQRGLVFCGAAEFKNIHIMNGKVRFINLASIWYFPDEDLRKEHGDERHWFTMENWFPALKSQQNNPPEPVLHRRWNQNIHLMPRISPDRPLFIWLSLDLPSERDRSKRDDEIFSWLRPKQKNPTQKRLTVGFRNTKDSTSSSLTQHVRRRDRERGIRSDHATDSPSPPSTPATDADSVDSADSEKTLVNCNAKLSVYSFPGFHPKYSFSSGWSTDGVREKKTGIYRPS